MPAQRLKAEGVAYLAKEENAKEIRDDRNLTMRSETGVNSRDLYDTLRLFTFIDIVSGKLSCQYYSA